MIDLLFVTAPRCRHCAHGRDVLTALSADLPLRWREVELDSDEGRALLSRWRAPFPPLLIATSADGDELLGHGRLSRRRLARQLEALLAAGGRAELAR